MNVQDINIWIEIKNITERVLRVLRRRWMAVVAEPGSADPGSFSVSLWITLCHCLLRSSRWLLPACPRTVESKTSVGPNKKHQRRNVFTPQEQISAKDSWKLMWKYLRSLSSSNFGSDEESVFYYFQHFHIELAPGATLILWFPNKRLLAIKFWSQEILRDSKTIVTFTWLDATGKPSY